MGDVGRDVIVTSASLFTMIQFSWDVTFDGAGGCGGGDAAVAAVSLLRRVDISESEM